ncbi:hypothetical protein ADUPG1_010771, partial [Aduncisulcus paluster]
MRESNSGSSEKESCKKSEDNAIFVDLTPKKEPSFPNSVPISTHSQDTEKVFHTSQPQFFPNPPTSSLDSFQEESESEYIVQPELMRESNSGSSEKESCKKSEDNAIFVDLTPKKEPSFPNSVPISTHSQDTEKVFHTSQPQFFPNPPTSSLDSFQEESESEYIVQPELVCVDRDWSIIPKTIVEMEDQESTLKYFYSLRDDVSSLFENFLMRESNSGSSEKESCKKSEDNAIFVDLTPKKEPSFPNSVPISTHSQDTEKVFHTSQPQFFPNPPTSSLDSFQEESESEYIVQPELVCVDRDWSIIPKTIVEMEDQESTLKYFYSLRDDVSSLFELYQHKSKEEIGEHVQEIIHCSQCISFFSSVIGFKLQQICSHKSKTEKRRDSTKWIKGINEIFSFLPIIAQFTIVFPRELASIFCDLCISYLANVKNFKIVYHFVDPASPVCHALHCIFSEGLSKSSLSESPLSQDTLHDVSVICRDISDVILRDGDKTGQVPTLFFELIRPYGIEWMQTYGDDLHVFNAFVTVFFSLVSCTNIDHPSCYSYCSQAIPCIIKHLNKVHFPTDSLRMNCDPDFQQCMIEVIEFFSKLCLHNTSNSLVIYDGLGNILNEWIKAIVHRTLKQYSSMKSARDGSVSSTSTFTCDTSIVVRCVCVWMNLVIIMSHCDDVRDRFEKSLSKNATIPQDTYGYDMFCSSKAEEQTQYVLEKVPAECKNGYFRVFHSSSRYATNSWSEDIKLIQSIQSLTDLNEFYSKRIAVHCKDLFAIPSSSCSSSSGPVSSIPRADDAKRDTDLKTFCQVITCVIDKSLSIEALTGEEIKIITERLFSSSIQHFMEYSKSKIQSAFP